jgi:hypothetical protein
MRNKLLAGKRCVYYGEPFATPNSILSVRTCHDPHEPGDILSITTLKFAAETSESLPLVSLRRTRNAEDAADHKRERREGDN